MSGWWQKRQANRLQPWKNKPRAEIRALFQTMAEAAAFFEGKNLYETAIARLNGAAARVIVETIDRGLSDEHLGDAMRAWAATAPLVERLSARQQADIMPNVKHEIVLTGSPMRTTCSCGYDPAGQNPDDEVAKHIALYARQP